MLLDILVHSEGPRIRDHISHGEVDLCEISQQSANYVLCICIAFVGLYVYPDKGHHRNSAFPLVERICETAKAYKSVFHPISVLAKTVRKLALSFLQWQDLPKPFGEEFGGLEGDGSKWTVKFPEAEKALQVLMTTVSLLPDDNVTKLSPCQFDFDQIDTFVHGCVQIVDASPCPTLFRPKGEIEVALLLRSIVQHGNVISDQASKLLYIK